MARNFWFWILLIVSLGTISPSAAQKVLVYEWEAINFNTQDTRKVTEMLRQCLVKKHEVVTASEMQQQIEKTSLVFPVHLEKDDLTRLAELFQAKYVVTGFLSQMEQQYTINVRLIEAATNDTLISVTKGIQETLFEPSQTFIPEIVAQLEKFLPEKKSAHQHHWRKVKIVSSAAVLSGAFLTWYLWPENKPEVENPIQLPRPPEFPK